MTLTAIEAPSTASWPESWGPAPRYFTPRTPARETLGPQVCAIAELLGLRLLPHQKYIWDVALEVQSEAAGDPNPGFWAYSTVDVTMPRRGGKSVMVQPVVMHRAQMIRRGRIALTAQTRDAAKDRWVEFSDLIEDSYLADHVKRLVSNSHEELRWLDTQAVMKPFAPNARRAHGSGYDLILADEVWDFRGQSGPDLDQAIRPMMLTKNLQIWRYSTAGDSESAYYNGIRALGRQSVEEGTTRGNFYIEWSVPTEVEGVKVEELPDDDLIQTIIDHHPRKNDFVDFRSHLEHELRTAQAPQGAGRHSFLRPYGNHTIEAMTRTEIVAPSVLMNGLTNQSIPQDPKVAVGLGFDIDPEGRQAALSAAWRDPATGRPRVELIRCALGTKWIGEFVLGRVERQTNLITLVGVNDTSYTRDLVDQLALAGVELERIVTLKDYAAACKRWFDATTDEPTKCLEHQGAPEYLEAIAAAEWEPLAGGGQKLRYPRDEPITALTSAIAALWTFDHLPEPEPDIGSFWIR